MQITLQHRFTYGFVHSRQLYLKGIQAVRIDFFYIKSCQYTMFYTNCS